MTSKKGYGDAFGRTVLVTTATSCGRSGGRYGIVIRVEGEEPLNLNEYRPSATSAEMQLSSLIRALNESYKQYGASKIDCFPGQYIAKYFELVPRWRAANWRNKNGAWIKHSRLWRQLEEASKKHLLVRFEEADDRAKAKKLARLAQALPATMANDDDDVGEDETLRAGDASVEQAPLRRQAGDAPNGD